MYNIYWSTTVISSFETSKTQFGFHRFTFSCISLHYADSYRKDNSQESAKIKLTEFEFFLVFTSIITSTFIDIYC